MLRPFRSQAGRWLFAGIAMLVWFVLPSPNAWAQGCVASREGVCVTDSHAGSSVWGMGGSHGESWLSPRRWEVEVDYRYFHSHRHFVGDVEQTQRAAQRTEVNNIVHIMNVTASYEVNPRFSMTLS